MAKRDDSFLAWLSDLSGPLTPHQSRLVLTTLIDLLRLESHDIRIVTHAFFSKFWNTTYLTGMREFEQIAKHARRPIRRGRPPQPLDQLRADYNAVLAWADCSTNPRLDEFRRALSRAQEAGVIPTGPHGPIPSARVNGLYQFREKPQPLALAVLRLITGKAVKTLREQIRPKAASW